MTVAEINDSCICPIMTFPYFSERTLHFTMKPRFYIDNFEKELCDILNVDIDDIFNIEMDYQYNSLDDDFVVKLLYNIDDHERIISAYNSLVGKYKIQTKELEYIADNNHKEFVNSYDANKYAIIGCDSKEFMNYKFMIFIRHTDDFIKKLKKCGFSNTRGADKFYIYCSFAGAIVGINLFFNNTMDIFPIKCLYPEINIREIVYFPFNGTKPLTYVE